MAHSSNTQLKEYSADAMLDALTLCTVPPTTHWRSATTPIRAFLLYATALPVGQLRHCSLQARGAQPPLSHVYPLAGMPLGRFVLPLCRSCVVERVTGYPGCAIAVTTTQSERLFRFCVPTVQGDSLCQCRACLTLLSWNPPSYSRAHVFFYSSTALFAPARRLSAAPPLADILPL